MVSRLRFLYLSVHFAYLTFNSVDVKALCVSAVILKYSNFNTDMYSLVTQFSDFLLGFMIKQRQRCALYLCYACESRLKCLQQDLFE